MRADRFSDILPWENQSMNTVFKDTGVNEILQVIEGLASNRLYPDLGPSNDPTIQSIIEQLNKTTQKLRERANAENEYGYHGSLERILDSLPNMVGFWNTDLVNVYSNVSYAQTMNQTKAELYGKHMSEVLGAEVFELIKPRAEAALRGENQSFEREIEIPGGKGKQFVLVQFISDVFDNKVSGFFAFISDVTTFRRREQKYQLVVNSMGEGLLVANTKGEFIKHNPAALKILGVTEEQLTSGMKIDQKWQCLRADGSPMPKEEYPSSVALKTGKEVLGKIVGLKGAAGDIRWIKINATPYSDISVTEDSSSVEVQSVLLTFGDVSDIIESKSQLDRIFEASVDFICRANANGFFTRVNPTFKRILGFTEEEMCAEPFINFVHPDDLELTLAQTKRKNKDRSTIFENRFRTKDGEYRRIAWHSQREDVTGEVIGFGRDITEERRVEENFKQIMRAVNECASVVSTDAHGILTEVNESFLQVSGYKREEIIGQGFRFFSEGLHENDFYIKISELLEKGQTWSGDVQSRNKAGELYWVRTVISPLITSDGQIEGYLSVRFDITAEKKAEEKALETSKFMEIILQNIPSMIFVKDYNKEMTYSLLNKAGQSIFGMSEEAVLGKNDYDFFPKHQADFFTSKDRAVIDGRHVVKIDREEIDTPMGKRILQTYKVPTFDSSGNPQHLIGISNDITEDIQMRSDLDMERAKSIRNSKLASLGEMSAGIAHEINNPLAIISGSVELLSKFANNPEKYAAKIESIKKSCDRISRIVTGLRKFSRSAEKNAFDFFNLSDIIKEALILTDAKSKRHGTPIEVDIPVAAPIYCDEVEIEQVLINLFNNAVDAVKNVPEKWVKVSLCEDGEALVLRVTDSGPGIPENVRNKLFEPFFTTKRVGEGTGLGLSITKGILDEHKATITVLSDTPNTCFELRFPKVIRGQDAA
jgi:PAS domain S-box-containing protein